MNAEKCFWKRVAAFNFALPHLVAEQPPTLHAPTRTTQARATVPMSSPSVVWDAAPVGKDCDWTDTDLCEKLESPEALTVTTLVLTNRPSGASVAAAVCGLLRRRRCSLRHLDLSGCDLTEGSVEEIGAALAQNETLQELILEDNQAVEERGGLALRRGMDCNLKVTMLRVGGCNMTHNMRAQIKRRVDMNMQYSRLVVRRRAAEE